MEVEGAPRIGLSLALASAIGVAPARATAAEQAAAEEVGGEAPAPPGAVALPERFIGELELARRLHQHYPFDFDDTWWDYVEDEQENAAEERPDPPRSFYQFLEGKAKRKRIGGIIVLAMGGPPTLVALTLFAIDPSEELVWIFGGLFGGVGVALLTVGGIKLGIANRNLVDLRAARTKVGVIAKSRLRWAGAAPIADHRLGTYGLGVRFAF